MLPSGLTSTPTLQHLIDQSTAPKQSDITCYCETCQKNTMHSSTEQYTLSPNQKTVTVLRNRAPDEFDAPVPICNLEHFSTSHHPKRSFQLAAGLTQYGSTPNSGHYCGFQRMSPGCYLYTNDGAAFPINSTQLVQTVPYVLFYTSTSTGT